MKKLLLLLCMTILLLSCVGNSGDKGGSSKDNTIRIVIGAEPASIDPQLSTDISGGTVNDYITEGLMKYNENGELVPGLAESYEISEDGLTWIFHLRDGILWSNGDPIVAQDFYDGWERALNPDVASNYAYMLYPIKNGEAYNTGNASVDELGIKVIDDKTLEVVLENPTPYFADLLTFKTYMPLNKAFYETVGEEYATAPDKIISSGPYILTEWVHNSKLSFVRNENYYNSDAISIDNVELSIIESPEAIVNAYENGEVDVISLTAQQADRYKDSPELVSSNDGSVWYLLMNNENQVLKNSKIRKSLLMAVDRGELTRDVLNGSGVIAETFVPAGIGIFGLNGDFPSEVSTKTVGYNPEEAKKLLAEGLSEVGLSEFPEFSLIINDNGNNKIIAEYIQESLNKNLGVVINLEVVEFKERIARTNQGDYDLALAGWSGDYHDPITYLDLFITNGGNNNAKYSNSRYDELIRIAQSSNDPKVRIPALIEVEEIIANDVVVGTLYHREKKYLVKPRIKNMKFRAIGGEYDGLYARIEE